MSNLHIGNAIQQSLGAHGAESSVQILNSARSECKQKIATVACQRKGEIRKCDGFWANMAAGKSKANGMKSADKRGGDYMPIWLIKYNAYGQE